MYWQEPNDDTKITLSPLTKITIGALTFAIFVFGVLPQPILSMLHEPARAAVEMKSTASTH